jgi:hypothetical protein
METSVPNRVFETTIAILALAQGVLGILRALHWFEVGSDLFGQGLLLLPMVGMVAYARGGLVAVIALLYVVFAWGLYTRRVWAWSLGMTVAIVNLLLVLSVLVQGEALLKALFWIIVPLVILWYLLAAPGAATWRTKRVGT